MARATGVYTPEPARSRKGRRRGVARRGEVFESPLNRQRAVFRETAADTGGELLRLDFYVGPGGFLGNEHLHPRQEERIEVLSGTLRCRVGGRERDLAEGEAITVPQGVTHTLWNEAEEEAHALVEYRLAQPYVQGALVGVPAPLGRLLGYRGWYPRYGDPA